MSNEYLSDEELKETKELRGTNYADLDISLAVETASRVVDNLTHRRFYLDTDANQVRYYTPRLKHLLYIDDLTTLTTLKIDRDGNGTFEETWAANTDFTREPLNAAADSRPWTILRVHPEGNYSEGFPKGMPRSIEVTGRFGWPTVPVQVKHATSLLASRLVLRAREAPLGVVAVGLDAAIRLARTDPDVMGLLAGVTRTDPLVT